MKSLAITADDFGLCRDQDLGIIEVCEKGVVTHVSLVANGENIDEAAKFLRSHPQTSAGIHLNITEGIQLLGAAVFGEGTSSYAANLSPLTTDEQFWAGSAGILANLSDDTRLELGVGYEDYDDAGKALGFGGGVYWDPVSQVTLGVGATYIDFKDAAVIDNDGLDVIGNEDSLEVFFGTWLRFP